MSVSIVAIVSAYNEADIIGQVVADLVEQGVDVYFMDDGSTDATIDAVKPYLGQGVIGIERLADTVPDKRPGTFGWERILERKTALARQLDADWFIHHDADEFRESPWPGETLRAAVERVDALGYNAIDFASLDFWPDHDRFRPGDDVREAFKYYAPSAMYDRTQIRCWKKTAELVDLSSSGGHDVRFAGRHVFPIRFILRHYPIRGEAHGRRKIFEERRNRFIEAERSKHWHVQYDDVREGETLIRDRASLTLYDPDRVRLTLALRHRGVEALEDAQRLARVEAESLRQTIDERTAELTARTAQLQTRDAELQARHAELQARHAELQARGVELEALHAELERCGRELDARTVELQQCMESLARSEAAGNAHRSEVDWLRQDLEHRRREIEGLRNALDDARRELQAFQKSLSWRWTAPARAAYRGLTKRS